MKESSMKEKLLPNVKFVWCECFELSELKDMPELHGQSDPSRAKMSFVVLLAGATPFVLPIGIKGLVVLA